MKSRTLDRHIQTTREAWKRFEQRCQGVEGTDIGLVVQGGGMRRVYSMDALAALKEMGFCQCFDHLVGSSAGAQWAYFLTKQASCEVEPYIHFLSKRNIIS